MESKAQRLRPRLLSEGDGKTSIGFEYLTLRMKTPKKKNVNDDERWVRYNELKKNGDVIKANKLKEEILDSYVWKKPCHHVAER